MSYYKGLPSSIKLGGFDIQVKVVKEIVIEGDKLICYGQYTHDDLLIELREQQATAAWAAVTAIHEVMHAIYNERHLQPGDDEERVVNQMSRGITEVLKRNPKFRAWLIKSLG